METQFMNGTDSICSVWEVDGTEDMDNRQKF